MVRFCTALAVITLSGSAMAAQPDEKGNGEPVENQALEVGKPAVDFTATGIDGKTFKLSDKLKQDKHIVLVFSRANW